MGWFNFASRFTSVEPSLLREDHSALILRRLKSNNEHEITEGEYCVYVAAKQAQKKTQEQAQKQPVVKNVIRDSEYWLDLVAGKIDPSPGEKS